MSDDEMFNNCLGILGDRSKPAKVRAEYLVLSANELGIDLVQPLAHVVSRLDKTAELEKQLAAVSAKLGEVEQEKSRPLQPEVFIGRAPAPDGGCWVLTNGGPLLLRGGQKDLDGIECGHYVLVDAQSGSVVGRDGSVPQSGEIATIADLPEDADGLVVVRLRDEEFVAHISAAARRSPHLRRGARAVYDPARRFVHRLLESSSDGAELLTPVSSLSSFTLESLGSPHPVIWEILNQIRRNVEHPDWAGTMHSRRRRSYLFHGKSGTGKTCTIKAIVNLVADWFGELTGERQANVCFCDAATFFSPYFGESERRIADWFSRLGRLARREVLARDGRRLVVPVIGVIEEVDGLLRARGEHDASSHLYDRLVSLFLDRLDSATNELDAPITFISTTNMKSLLDPAARRRLAAREVCFHALDARGALAVLEKKLPAGMPIRSAATSDPKLARDQVLRQILFRLFGDSDDQVLAEVVMRDAKRLPVLRRQLVTGAVIESAVSQAIDRSLDRSQEAGELLGIDAETLIEACDAQIDALSSSLSRRNVHEHVPELLEADDPFQVADVRRIRRPRRRPLAAFAG
jgi:ATP-dependent 26S proteasome regulatory subunit